MIKFLRRLAAHFQILKHRPPRFGVYCDLSGQRWIFQASTRNALTCQILSGIYGATPRQALDLANQAFWCEPEFTDQVLHIKRMQE